MSEGLRFESFEITHSPEKGKGETEQTPEWCYVCGKHASAASAHCDTCNKPVCNVHGASWESGAGFMTLCYPEIGGCYRARLRRLR